MRNLLRGIIFLSALTLGSGSTLAQSVDADNAVEFLNARENIQRKPGGGSTDPTVVVINEEKLMNILINKGGMSDEEASYLTQEILNGQ